jgi:hypothetical protein
MADQDLGVLCLLSSVLLDADPPRLEIFFDLEFGSRF